LDGEYLGKPHSANEARNTLQKISGRKQEFVTGLAVINTTAADNKTVTDFILGEIWIKKITDKEIEDYIKTGEPFSKAGGYSIQGIGSVFIEKIRGDYAGIVGLPMDKLYNILKSMDVKVF